MSEFKTEISVHKYTESFKDYDGKFKTRKAIEFSLDKGEIRMFICFKGREDVDVVQGMEKLLTEAYSHLTLNRDTYS